MGVISRKIFPACGSMCVCCPALRSRSRQPVKRYKKLVADIFPKSPDEQPNDRKLVKLCEYAAKNPIRIPKITKYLEERFYREMRNGHQKIIAIIMEAYNKFICMCDKQMAYFAGSLLTLASELLDNSKEVEMQITGCQTLTKFIYSQSDGIYARNVENLVSKVCVLAREIGEEDHKRSLRASSLQCLSAMVWYMTEHAQVFDNVDEIVHATLDNYGPNLHTEDGEMGGRHHWVDEVVRCEGKGGAGLGNVNGSIAIRPAPEKKTIYSLTKEEIENPKVWAHICLQRMGELAKESTTMRRVLDPMFHYFDIGCYWGPHQRFALVVLSDLCYFVEVKENQLLILAGVIRHLDHKNVSHDPQVKSDIIQVAAYLAKQIRSGTTFSEIGCISDLLRHLRKSLQATASPIGEEDTNLNIQLQNSIESCLLEMANGIKDAGPLFDLMVLTLEKLPPVGNVARAAIGSLLILAHIFSVASVYSRSQKVFPEAFLVQLLKTMLHPDADTRVGAHHIFSVLLFPDSRRSAYCNETKRWKSGNNSSAFASVTALLEKLRKEKGGMSEEKVGNGVLDDCKGRECSEEEHNQGFARKTSPKFYKLTNIMDRTVGSNKSAEPESNVMKLSEDQILQLLSGFWIQMNLPDNLPSNYEAIAHSYNLTLMSFHLKNSDCNLVIRFFQLPLSLRSISLDPSSGILPPACQRSILVTSTAMLMSAARLYHIYELNDLLRSLVPQDVDPYLGISEDFQVYVKTQVDIKRYGSMVDNQAATALLCELRDKNIESEKTMLDILARHLCCITKVEEEEIRRELPGAFCPDDAFMFAPPSMRDLDHIRMVGHSKGSPSLDADLSISSAVEDDAISVCSVANLSRPRVTPTSTPDIMSIGQLLESALEVAGQVVGTTVSTSPLPYSTMAGHCEALGSGTRKKLSNWLAYETHHTTAASDPFSSPRSDIRGAISKITGDAEADSGIGVAFPRDQSLSLRLPPASPFDNFLRAAAGPGLGVVELRG